LRHTIAKIPQKHIASAGKVVGKILYSLNRRHRRIVIRNLRFTHPHYSHARIHALAHEVFQNAGITALEILQMSCFSRQDILGRVRVRGKEHLRQVINKGSGAILISAHLGNWEMGPLFIACYFQEPMVVVARPVRPDPLNRWLQGGRARFGNTVLYKKGAVPKAVRLLREGKLLALLIDQGVTRAEGLDVTFFYHPVPATPMVAILARRYDCPVVPAFCVRESDGTLALIVKPPLELQKTSDINGDLKANTQIMYSALEQAIRTYPGQWFWFHKRWKRYHPFLYPEDLARRQRRREKRAKRARERKAPSA
jgi:KDO2-lipid IV(A) lauroyltransferase